MPTRSIPLLLLALLAVARPARADGETRIRFDAEIARIGSQAEAATRRVQAALAAQDWNAWNVAHDAYLMTLAQGVVDVENAITRLLFGVLEAGGQLGDDDLRAVDAAADLVGDHARRRTLAQAWGSLTRNGVRPDRRMAALDLLDRQGVYGEGGRAPVSAAPAGTSATDNVSPFSGRTPTTTEAAQHLGKWQYAYMRAQSVEQAISAQELQLVSLSEGTTLRQQAEQRLATLRAERAELQRSMREWRQKYFAAGGK